MRRNINQTDYKLDVIAFIALATTLIVIIGHLMRVGLW